MVKAGVITFHPAAQPIQEPVTKFGGQPCWLESPQWPISKTTGEPMMFICQVALSPELFSDSAINLSLELFPDEATKPSLGSAAKMAYLFMSEDGATFAPDGGDNAIILQPGAPQVPVLSLPEGPSLAEYVEYAVTLTIVVEPDFIPELTLFEMSDQESNAYRNALAPNKIGGTPGFLQGDQFPSKTERWRLLLQLDSGSVPFDINFGDVGIGYAFLNMEGTVGKFLWQCH